MACCSSPCVAAGTASNYFSSRDALFTQAGARVYERLQPDEATIARQQAVGRDRDAYVELMRELVGLTERVRADVDANVAHHETSGLPGDITAVKLLMLTLNWLIVEQLTLPDVFTEAEREQLVMAAVERIVAAD